MVGAEAGGRGGGGEGGGKGSRSGGEGERAGRRKGEGERDLGRSDWGRVKSGGGALLGDLERERAEKTGSEKSVTF